HRRGQRPGGHESRAEAAHRRNGGTYHHAPEALEQPHGRQRREDHQGGDQHGTHHPHPQHDGQGGENGQQGVVPVHPQPRGPGEALIERHGEELVVEQHEQGQHRKGQYRRQGHIRPRHGQDAAEHVVVHIRGHAAGAGDDDDADGQGRRTHDGDGRVAVPAGIGGQPQQEERREDHHGDGEVEGSEPQGHGDGQGAEGDVAEAIADHGVPL
ncbi:Ion-translocating oxidoreductase complex subunit G, partial [Dysosmobacter welbionis]